MSCLYVFQCTPFKADVVMQTKDLFLFPSKASKIMKLCSNMIQYMKLQLYPPHCSFFFFYSCLISLHTASVFRLVSGCEIHPNCVSLSAQAWSNSSSAAPGVHCLTPGAEILRLCGSEEVVAAVNVWVEEQKTCGCPCASPTPVSLCEMNGGGGGVSRSGCVTWKRSA